MAKLNPYLHLITLGYVATKGALNRPVKIGNNRNKKDDKGNTVYHGGAGEVHVYALGSLEIHVEHDKSGNHLVSLYDVKTGDVSGKLPYRAVKSLKLFEKQAKGQNIWSAFNA